MKGAKRKGTRNEHRSRLLLEAEGYRVTRAAGSLGLWDLVGIRAEDVILGQVKTRDWPGLLERQLLAEFPAPVNARKVLHRWRDRERRPDVQPLGPAVLIPQFNAGRPDSRAQWTSSESQSATKRENAGRHSA